MPTFNGARHLREALHGLSHQGDLPFDLIVSDDRSDDETVAIVSREMGDRARIEVNPERLGLAGNWNRCVELSRTEWVAIFHQDDLMLPGHLQAHQQVIETYPSLRIGIIAGQVTMVDEEGARIAPHRIDPGGLQTRDRSPVSILGPDLAGRLFLQQNPLRCSAVTIRKEAHHSLGGFDPSYRYVVDWDFWSRLVQTWSLAYLNGPATVAMRWHGGSETHRFKTGTADLDEQIRLIDRLFETGMPTRRDRKSSDDRLARAFLNRAHEALKAGDLDLARSCLARSIGRSPRIGWTIALDPRLAVQMASLALAPRLARRWFSRGP